MSLYTNIKKNYRSKSVERGKGLEDTPSTYVKSSSQEGGDVYLDSTITKLENDVWLIDSCNSFHMTPHREWYYEYHKYNGGDVFLGYELTSKIIGHGRVKLLLKYESNKTLLGVFHIPYLAKILTYIRKMSDAGVHTILENEGCKMIQGEMILMRGFRCATLCKLL